VARHRFLKNAPIREAIIDLKVAPAVDHTRLEPLFESWKKRFPKQEPLQQTTFGFAFGPNELHSSRIDGGIQGRRLTSEDGRYIVQLRTDGFTFSRLPPYETWEVMRAEAKPLWDDYLRHSGAEKVTRAAVRYINVMDLPMPIRDFKDYLCAPPEIPASLPQELGGFFSRVVIVHRELDGAAVVTQVLKTSFENKVQVVLDIDVFREAKETDWPANDPSVWGTLDRMRDFKNQIFFESITETTAELFA
jgi:uncharacterized protein (TIGR04255 family)